MYAEIATWGRDQEADVNCGEIVSKYVFSLNVMQVSPFGRYSGKV